MIYNLFWWHATTSIIIYQWYQSLDRPVPKSWAFLVMAVQHVQPRFFLIESRWLLVKSHLWLWKHHLNLVYSCSFCFSCVSIFFLVVQSSFDICTDQQWPSVITLIIWSSEILLFSSEIIITGSGGRSKKCGKGSQASIQFDDSIAQQIQEVLESTWGWTKKLRET